MQYVSKICFHGVFFRVFRHTVLKPHSACTTQLASSIVFKCFSQNCCIGNSQQNSKQESFDLLICWSFSSSSKLTKHDKKVKRGSTNSLNSPDFCLAFNLMHGKQEFLVSSFQYSLLLNITTQNCQSSLCFQTILLFLVTIICSALGYDK